MIKIVNQIIPLEQALELLAHIARQQVQAHAAAVHFSLESVKEDVRWKYVREILGVDDGDEDSLLPIMALAPHVMPGFYENIISRALPQGGEFAEFGGIKGQQHRGMLPTGETALFILCGMDIDERIRVMRRWRHSSWPLKEVLSIEKVREGEPAMSGALVPNPDWLEPLLFGRNAEPAFSVAFPAKRIHTPMLWSDLVLHPRTLEQVNDIRIWLEYNGQVLTDPVLMRKVKPGYRILFYGPSGTGKTLTASLLGNEFKLPVYRIDLSQVVSKYIGETEKNLESVFAKASRKNWILFFDEADALFGKRTSVSSAHDKYANQEVSYLLQRIEEHEGLLILASNFKNNIDDAFLRRFHHIIHFPLPGVAERLGIWKGCAPGSLKVDPSLVWEEIAGAFELTGASIVNVMQYAALRAFRRGDGLLRKQDIVEGIKKEFRKEEKNI